MTELEMMFYIIMMVITISVFFCCQKNTVFNIKAYLLGISNNHTLEDKSTLPSALIKIESIAVVGSANHTPSKAKPSCVSRIFDRQDLVS